MTRAEYNLVMSKNPLWKLMDTNNYRRGQEIQREMTVDDGDFDDDFETHAKRETLTHRELI